MTTLTVTEPEVAAECSPAGVARRASLRAARCEVLRGGCRTHLSRLRCARREFVAVGACQSLSRAVVCVTEGVSISARVGAGWTIRFLIVTDTAGRDLAAGARTTRRRVTGVTDVVRREICGDRQPGAPLHGRAVTAHTTVLRTRRSGHVLRVIKFHVERLVEACGKISQRRIAGLHVGMTDQAHGYRRCCELPAMAIGAGFVTGKPRRRRIVGAFVTGVAGKRAMACAAVEKLRVVGAGVLGHG